MTVDEEADGHHKEEEIVVLFFLNDLPVQLNLTKLSDPSVCR